MIRQINYDSLKKSCRITKLINKNMWFSRKSLKFKFSEAPNHENFGAESEILGAE